MDANGVIKWCKAILWIVLVVFVLLVLVGCPFLFYFSAAS